MVDAEKGEVDVVRPHISKAKGATLCTDSEVRVGGGVASDVDEGENADDGDMHLQSLIDDIVSESASPKSLHMLDPASSIVMSRVTAPEIGVPSMYKVWPSETSSREAAETSSHVYVFCAVCCWIGQDDVVDESVEENGRKCTRPVVSSKEVLSEPDVVDGETCVKKSVDVRENPATEKMDTPDSSGVDNPAVQAMVDDLDTTNIAVACRYPSV
ncbi:unnamed protein product [Microthlaspi erraticum]|uniref:Uncharacterized protein n=1 Tax=Microthlaspi erraticum TaxID=1685480 RepID=A0A6D2L867_9BRAS|nr:unnamed protein product [Microthlaspi erraticum]